MKYESNMSKPGVWPSLPRLSHSFPEPVCSRANSFLNLDRCFLNSADLKQKSRVHDKVDEIQLAISGSANISAQIENKSRWIMLAICRVMLAIRRAMLAIRSTMHTASQIMHAIGPVQDNPRSVR